MVPKLQAGTITVNSFVSQVPPPPETSTYNELQVPASSLVTLGNNSNVKDFPSVVVF